MLRISAYGQTGPMRDKPGFARIAHAFAGLTALAGEKDGPPVVPGSTSLADYISGIWGALGVVLALRVKERTGQGQFIDIALYELVFRLLDEMAPAYAKTGFVRERMGADTVNVAPHSHYRTATGQWVAIACTSDKMFERLAQVMGEPQLAAMPEFATSQARVERRDEVNGMVARWVGSLPLQEVLARCEAGEVPCGPVYDIADIFRDAQYRGAGEPAAGGRCEGRAAGPSRGGAAALGNARRVQACGPCARGGHRGGAGQPARHERRCASRLVGGGSDLKALAGGRSRQPHPHQERHRT